MIKPAVTFPSGSPHRARDGCQEHVGDADAVPCGQVASLCQPQAHHPESARRVVAARQPSIGPAVRRKLSQTNYHVPRVMEHPLRPHRRPWSGLPDAAGAFQQGHRLHDRVEAVAECVMHNEDGGRLTRT